jgi:hypothetical protein
VKAISLWQPWASLIADGRKRIETRSWKAPGWLLGKKIAIHAAKIANIDAAADFGYEYAGKFVGPRGAIVATAYLESCVQFTPENVERISDEEKLYGDFALGRFGWFLTDVERIEPPIEVRGHQGIFEWHGESPKGENEQ